MMAVLETLRLVQLASGFAQDLGVDADALQLHADPLCAHEVQARVGS